MNEAMILKKVSELNDAMTVSHAGRVNKAVAQDGVYVPERPTESTSLGDAVELLGLHIKYLMFDLEATRRENRYLRQMLESRPPRRRGEEDDSGH